MLAARFNAGADLLANPLRAAATLNMLCGAIPSMRRHRAAARPYPADVAPQDGPVAALRDVWVALRGPCRALRRAGSAMLRWRRGGRITRMRRPRHSHLSLGLSLVALVWLVGGCSRASLHTVSGVDELRHCGHVADVRVLDSRSYGSNPPLAYLDPYHWWVWEDHSQDANLRMLAVRQGPPVPVELRYRTLRVSDGARPGLSPLLVGTEATIGFQSVSRSGLIKGDVWVVQPVISRTKEENPSFPDTR